MNVPLLDLVAQYNSIRDEIEPALRSRHRTAGASSWAPRSRRWSRRSRRCRTSGMPSPARAAPTPCSSRIRALDLKPGDEVIAPAFTFFATAGAIHNAGGTPVFADIDAGHVQRAPEAIEAAITPRTRAIVVVHLFGQMAPMERIVPIARKHGLAIIEDGAQSIGARRRDRRHLARGRASSAPWAPSRSSRARTSAAWGDGGMMLTQDDALAEPAAPAAAARRRAAVPPRRSRLQQPARLAAGGGAAGQAAAPAGVERGAARAGRVV